MVEQKQQQKQVEQVEQVGQVMVVALVPQEHLQQPILVVVGVVEALPVMQEVQVALE